MLATSGMGVLGQEEGDEPQVVEQYEEPEETVPEPPQQEAEPVQEEPEPVPEPEPEPEPEVNHPAPVPEQAPAVTEEVSSEASKAGTFVSSKLAPIKEKVLAAVGKVVDCAKSMIDRVKNMSKTQVKKVAAAVLGVWGVSVGVGYLTSASSAAKDVVGKKK